MKKKIFISYTVIKLIVIILFSTGCVQKDRDVFWVDNNFGDDEPVKAVMTLMKDSLNKREISPLLTCFDEAINFPDALNPSIKVTYRTLMYDYMDFFKKIESIGYEFNDQYIIMSEHTAKVTIKLRKRYKAVSPFSHNVDNTVDETVIITKNASGAWKITKISELLPPRIY
ncbi:MAG TPA: hypothetical protein PKW98_08060 [Candidatus Wallbacteria bacterium]|nr:hypothetical protein [Candidatus Wallbacteria bacterium]